MGAVNLSESNLHETQIHFSWFPYSFPDWPLPSHCGATTSPQRRRTMTFQSRQRDDSHRFPQGFVREPLSLFSLSFFTLFFFCLFFSEGWGSPEMRPITAETHTQSNANQARVQDPPTTPTKGPWWPSLQSEKHYSMQKNKIRSISFLVFLGGATKTQNSVHKYLHSLLYTLEKHASCLCVWKMKIVFIIFIRPSAA